MLAKFNKMPKQYRLDLNLVGFVEAIASKKGITETAVIEMAVSNLAKQELTDKEKEDAMMKKYREVMGLEEN